ATSALAVSFSSTGACTNTGATFTITNAASACTVSYDAAGNENYNAAPQVTETVTAQTADQTITVTTGTAATGAYNASFTVAATASSGLPVSFGSSGACTNSGASFTITSGTGTCTVSYDAAGNESYSAAPQVTETVTAQKADQSITFEAPEQKTYGDTDFAISASASSGLVLSFSASGDCTVT